MNRSLFLSRLGDFKTRMSRSQRLALLTAGVGLAALLIGLFAVHLPWMEQRRRLADQVAEEEQRSDLLRGIQRVRESRSRSEQKWLLAGGTAELAGEISRLAAQTGVEIQSVTPEEEIPLDPYVQQPIRVIAAATPRNLMRFLGQIEQHEPFLRVNQMEVGDPAALSEGSGSGAEPGVLFEPSQEQRVELIVSALARKREGK